MLNNSSNSTLLKSLRKILTSEDLSTQRDTLKAIATELNVKNLDCAAALLHLLQTTTTSPVIDAKASVTTRQLNIKMVRYRLSIGSQHQLTLDTLKQVLVEESGVDKNNINNVKIQDEYTLCDLPDEMPLDIFQHLKSVEINQHKLDIRRVKNRNKKRGLNHHRRNRQTDKLSQDSA